MACDQFEKWRHFCFGILWMVLHFVWYINLVWIRVAFGINNIVLIYISTSRKTWSSLTSNHTHTQRTTCIKEEKKNCLCKHMAALVLSVFYRHSWFVFSVFFSLTLLECFCITKAKFEDNIYLNNRQIWQQVAAEFLFFFSLSHENAIDPIDKLFSLKTYKFWQTNWWSKFNQVNSN